MKYYYFDGEINTESTNRLIEFVNSLDSKEKFTIYLQSEGGETWAARLLSDIINTNKKRVTLIANGFIGSAAFNLFFKAQCERFISPHTTGMTHFIQQEIRHHGLKINPNDKVFLEELICLQEDALDFVTNTIGLTKKELKDYNDAKEVYFSYDRLQEFLKLTS